jgi:hypothetical protein
MVERFIEQTGVSFPVAFDAGSYAGFRGAGGAGIAPFPLDVIIDRSGRVAYVSRKYQAAAMQTIIERLLAK